MYEDFLGVNPWTALFVLLNTLTVYFVARKYLFAPVMKIIAERQEEIDSLYSDAAAAREQAQAIASEYSAKLSDARTAGDRIVKEAVDRARHREEEILRQANLEAAALLEKAVSDAALERNKAINEAKNGISIISLAIAEKVLERQLSGADQHMLVNQFIDNLGDAL